MRTSQYTNAECAARWNRLFPHSMLQLVLCLCKTPRSSWQRSSMHSLLKCMHQLPEWLDSWSRFLGWKATVNEGGVVSKTLQVNHLQRMLSRHGETKLCKQRTGNVKTAEILTILHETSEQRGCTSPRSITYMHHDINKLRASVIFVKFGGCTDQSALDKFEGFF